MLPSPYGTAMSVAKDEHAWSPEKNTLEMQERTGLQRLQALLTTLPGDRELGLRKVG